MLRIGKVSENVLKRSVLKQIKSQNGGVILKAAVGEDAGALWLSDDANVLYSVGTVVFDHEYAHKELVISVANDIAVTGGKILGITLAVLLPANSEESVLKSVIKSIELECEGLGIQILGGHTEVTASVVSPVVTVTGIGKSTGKIVSSKGCKPGDDIIVTKQIALQGTSRIASNKKDELYNRFSNAFVDRAIDFIDLLDVSKEASIAINFGASAMHNASEGGIFGALWEIASASNVGMEIDLLKLPIKQESVEICEEYGINPYELLSGGSVIITASDGQGLVRELDKEGISSTIVGKITDSNDRVILNGDERRFLDLPQMDEIYKL